MTQTIRFRLPARCAAALLAAAMTTLPLAAPLLRADDKPVADPAPPAEFLAKLDPQMREVVQAILEAKPKPFYQLDPDAARRQPPPGVAAATVAKKRGKAALDEVGDRDKIAVAGTGGAKLDALLFRPEGNKGKDPVALPVLVYFHGGGFVVADAKVYESSARALADAAGCVVISVNYRRSPEVKFPTPVEDCYAAVQDIITNAKELNIDSKRVAVGGESAGGNAATVVCLMARERGGAMPVHQLLVYPVTDWNSTRPSHVENGLSPTLLEKNLPWFSGLYFAKQEDSKLPFASPINATDLRGLPPATVILADLDVLRDDGKAYAEKLQAAGVPVAMETYPGVLHEFFGMGAAVDQARKAEGFAAGELKKAFGGDTAATK